MPHQPAAVEQLLKTAVERSDVVSLAGGLPADDLFPRDDLAAALDRVMTEHGSEALQYQWCEGYAPLREQVAALLRHRGVAVGADDLLITHGAQQALDLLARLLLRAGDPLVLESPAYTAAIQVFGLQRPRMIPLPRDEHGLDLDVVRAALREPRQSLVYLTPAGHNPTGSALAPDVGAALVDLARAHDAYIIEDDAYGAIQLDEPRPSLRACPGAADRVIHVGTVSKVLSPGLRIGWIAAPPALLGPLTRLKAMIDLQTNTLGQMALSAYLDAHDLRDHLARSLPRYRERRDAMLDALAEHMPRGLRWTRPTAGFSVWLTLPDHLDAADLLAPAVDAGVAFEPGAAFFPADAPAHHLRLSFSNTDLADITEGTRRLATAVAAAST